MQRSRRQAELIIPPMENREKKTKPHILPDMDIVHNQPLKSQLNLLLCKAANGFCDKEDKEHLRHNMLRLLEEIQTQYPCFVGLLNFHRIVVEIIVCCNGIKEPGKLYRTKISYHKASLEKFRDSVDLQQVQKEAIVKCYLDL